MTGSRFLSAVILLALITATSAARASDGLHPSLHGIEGWLESGAVQHFRENRRKSNTGLPSAAVSSKRGTDIPRTGTCEPIR